MQTAQARFSLGRREYGKAYRAYMKRYSPKAKRAKWTVPLFFAVSAALWASGERGFLEIACLLLSGAACLALAFVQFGLPMLAYRKESWPVALEASREGVALERGNGRKESLPWEAYAEIYEDGPFLYLVEFAMRFTAVPVAAFGEGGIGALKALSPENAWKGPVSAASGYTSESAKDGGPLSKSAPPKK